MTGPLGREYYTGMFPVGDTSCRTLIAACVCVRACARARARSACVCCLCVCVSADISLNCAKND